MATIMTHESLRSACASCTVDRSSLQKGKSFSLIACSRRHSGGRRPTVSWAQHMNGRAHPSPFAALSVFIRNKYPLSAGLTERGHRMAKPGFELMNFRQLSEPKQVALTTRPRRLSVCRQIKVHCNICIQRQRCTDVQVHSNLFNVLNRPQC